MTRDLANLQARIEHVLGGRPGSVLVGHCPDRAGYVVRRALRVGGERYEQECWISYDLVHSNAPNEAIARSVGHDLEALAWRHCPEVPLTDAERFRNEFLVELIQVLNFKRDGAFPLTDLIEEVRRRTEDNFFGLHIGEAP